MVIYVIGDCGNCIVFDIYVCVLGECSGGDYCWCVEYV